jgi:hypothetical protein
MTLGTVGIVVAVLLAAVGMQMQERGIGKAEIAEVLEGIWNKTIERSPRGPGNEVESMAARIWLESSWQIAVALAAGIGLAGYV